MYPLKFIKDCDFPYLCNSLPEGNPSHFRGFEDEGVLWVDDQRLHTSQFSRWPGGTFANRDPSTGAMGLGKACLGWMDEELLSGWWFGRFFHILGIVIPIDYIFQRGWNHQPVIIVNIVQVVIIVTGVWFWWYL